VKGERYYRCRDGSEEWGFDCENVEGGLENIAGQTGVDWLDSLHMSANFFWRIDDGVVYFGFEQFECC